MTKNTQNQLGKALWKIADELRGAMNADDFRDYMLSFIFLKYLSDNYIDSVKKELGSDYPADIASKENELVLQEEKNDIDKAEKPKRALVSPLEVWYRENEDDTALLEDQMRRKVHYVIRPEHLWFHIAELARTQHTDLLQSVEESFDFIEKESFGKNFQGLFSEINLNSEKLGKGYTERNKKLCNIISAIADGIAKFSTDVDSLGDAYEFLIGKFAAGSGRKAGEFYTPQRISDILSGIVSLDSQDPTYGKKNKLESVFDFACGSGSLLLNVRKNMGEFGIDKIYGQEKNITTYNLARMNMLLHGVKDTEFDIFHGDTLTNDWNLLNEMNPAKKIEFDAIVANPPFSLRWDPKDSLNQDFRFKNYGLAPKSAADFAFLLHGFHFLKEDGTMAIILPHGVLFRRGAEEKIRTKLLKDNHIDAVIGLPPNLFYSTGIPVCILILKKCKQKDDVLFINASSEENFAKKRRQNELRKKDVKKIVETYKYRTEEDRYSRAVSMEEIEENGYNLNITRYISTAKEEPRIDLADVNKKLKNLNEEIEKARKEHNSFLKELGLSEI